MPQTGRLRVLPKPNEITGKKNTLLRINSRTGAPIRASHQNARDRTTLIIRELRAAGWSNAKIMNELVKYKTKRMLKDFEEAERGSPNPVHKK